MALYLEGKIRVATNDLPPGTVKKVVFELQARNEIGTWHRAGGVQTRGIGREIANDFPRAKR